MTSVLLGVCEESISSKAVTSWQDNKVGGTPDWYQSGPSNPKCDLCGRMSWFICQLYCPLANSQYHRTLYVFACCNESCKNKDGSWSVLRFQSLTKEEPRKSHLNDADADFWGVDDNWSDEDDIADTSEKSEASDSRFNICSDAVECSSVNEASAQETEDVSDGYMNGRTAGSELGESESKELPGRSSDSETAMKLSQLSVKDFEDDAESDIADEVEAPVLVEEALLNVDCSMLSKLLANSSAKIEVQTVAADNYSTDTTIFDSFYINVYSEEDFAVDMRHCLALEQKYLRLDTELRSFLQELDGTVSDCQKSSKGPSKGTAEKYGANEYDKKPVHFDRAVFKFAEKMKLCPQQVIRYCYNGVPLHFQEQAAQRSIPHCDCGSHRIFEMQLMPAMIDCLRLPNFSGNLFEFGSAYVYTCASSCWTEATMQPRNEFIFCAEYSDQNLFRKDI